MHVAMAKVLLSHILYVYLINNNIIIIAGTGYRMCWSILCLFWTIDIKGTTIWRTNIVYSF